MIFWHTFSPKIKWLILLLFIFLFINQKLYAQSDTAFEKKSVLESQAASNPYVISLYQPTYFMPFNYVSSFSEAAETDTPDNQGLNHIEAKFQFSVKTAVFKNIFNYKNSLNLAYTQLSFWQLYNNSPFFRETNYQPEIFFENILDKNLWSSAWKLHNFNIGFIHDSNGRGGSNERSWNRVYGETVFSNPNWMVSIRPWYVMNTESLQNNRDIAQFLGYERVVISYQLHKQVFSLQSYNLEHINSKASVELTWSFPLIQQIRGYVQLFSGYGQSLIDYNQHANSASIGIALNDWL